MSKDILRDKADQYAHLAYGLARKFPKDELFGLTSQLRRASISVPLNIIEGYARQSVKSERQFLMIAYGSLKESGYLLSFAKEENYLNEDDIIVINGIGEELAKMIWSKAKTLANKQ